MSRNLIFTVLASASLFSASSVFASADYDCVGENENEKLSFMLDGPEELILSSVSENLAPEGGEIAKGDDEVYLAIDSREINGPIPTTRTVKFDLWDGNWGYEVKIPRKLYADGIDNGVPFKISYRYDYNDTEVGNLKRTLTCVGVN